VAIDASKLRHGRYFREHFAQAGIDLMQIICKSHACTSRETTRAGVTTPEQVREREAVTNPWLDLSAKPG